jgi:hypothetical protein
MATIERRSASANKISPDGKCTVDLDLRVRAKGLTVSTSRLIAIVAAVLAFAITIVQFYARR